jgi:hypothetical protein
MAYNQHRALNVPYQGMVEMYATRVHAIIDPRQEQTNEVAEDFIKEIQDDVEGGSDRLDSFRDQLEVCPRADGESSG